MPDPLLKTLLYSNLDKIEAIQHGRTNEAIVALKYHDLVRPETLGEPGIFICAEPKFAYLGASPDRIAKFTTGEVKLVEIKCFSQKFTTDISTVKELAKIRGSQFCCSLTENDTLEVKPNSNYFYQMQGQMAITGIHKCDFVLSFKDDIQVLAVEFDKCFWEKMKLKLRKFYIHILLPEFRTLRVKNGLKLYDTNLRTLNIV